METRLEKYLRLFGLLALTAIGIILVGVLLLLLFRMLFGILDSFSWFSVFFLFCMLLLPGALLLGVYYVFYKKTAFHPSVTVKRISRSLFLLASITAGSVMVYDLIHFFRTMATDTDKYFSYNLGFLVSNGALIFLIGILQALTTGKEKDWMERR